MSLFQTIHATWPAASESRSGPFTLRDGAGGGKRVSAASFEGATAPSEADLAEAEAAMHARDQAPLFALRPEQTAFDGMLESRGYQLLDPTLHHHIDIHTLTTEPVPPVTAFAVWEPLAIMEDLWAEAGIGPARLAVMDRAIDPKTGILGRIEDTPAGAAFVAIHRDTAMLHALEVLPKFRRKGLAGWMIRAAAHWAKAQGARRFSLLVTKANAPANALYRGMGFASEPGYHYREQTPQ